MVSQSPQYWDELAAAFDDEPDHGLRDPIVREAWLARLSHWLPSNRAAILDIGCGTGSLSVLLAVLGHEVIGIDWSALPPSFTNVTVDDLSNEPQLWGGPVADERYTVIARQQ
jgi:2-polyprenyl-3-methyl-5-hydroxy-6-metoxy-1,4-benzoquinol methylase